MQSDSGSSLDVFSQFYAVVLDHAMHGGRRVRWSSRHAAWISTRSSDYGGSRPWLDEPGETFGRPDAPTEESRSDALALARSVTHPEGRAFACEWCRLDNAAAHFIAPDVYGDPQLYCVQVPAFSAVGSSGGNGDKKHWGSPFACHSVHMQIDSGFGREPYIGPLAAYLFGRPLPADQVIDRAWCSRCVGFAENVRTNAVVQGGDELKWAKDRVHAQVMKLSRALLDYYGDK